MIAVWHETSSGQFFMGFGPPVKHEKVGGAGLSARRGHKFMVRKTHPTADFSEQLLMGLWPTRKL